MPDKGSQSRLGCIVICAILLAMPLAAQVKVAGPQATAAIQGIVAICKQHPVVIIGEAHWLREAGDLYVQLVRDPQFQNTVQDIVVEFASRNNQPLLDRYIAGDDIPVQDVQRIWRDTTKVASWESPVYGRWLAAIRDANRGLPPARRMRVLAGDTAIDWSRIHNHADWAALGDNNVSFADVIVEEVLKKKHHALVVLGTNHVTKSGDRNGGPNTTTRVESRYRGSTHVILLIYHRTLNRSSQDLLRLTEYKPPVIFDLHQPSLSKLTDQDDALLSNKADALLYLGPADSLQLVPPPAGSLDPTYMKEIDRRSLIEWGELRARKFLGAAAQ